MTRSSPTEMMSGTENPEGPRSKPLPLSSPFLRDSYSRGWCRSNTEWIFSEDHEYTGIYLNKWYREGVVRREPNIKPPESSNLQTFGFRKGHDGSVSMKEELFVNSLLT